MKLETVGVLDRVCDLTFLVCVVEPLCRLHTTVTQCYLVALFLRQGSLVDVAKTKTHSCGP